MYEIAVAVALYGVIVLLLVGLIMVAKRTLIPSGDLKIRVNQQRDLTVSPGGKLLGDLAQNGIFVAAACGGGGTCAQCRVKVTSGGGYILPTEQAHINKREAREHWRLACQVAVKQDMEVEVPPEVVKASSSPSPSTVSRSTSVRVGTRVTLPSRSTIASPMYSLVRPSIENTSM